MQAKPYYRSYLEQAGLSPRHREISYLIDLTKIDNAFLLSMKNIAELKIRPVTSKSYLQDHDIVIDIFNVSFVDKWYFSGYDHATSRKYWSENKSFVDPDLFLIAEIENKPVGFLNAYPDLNPSIQALQGKLGLLSIIKFLWKKRAIKTGIVFVVGMLPGQANRGVGKALLASVLCTMKKKGYLNCYCHTISEENIPSRRMVEALGGVEAGNFMGFYKDLK